MCFRLYIIPSIVPYSHCPATWCVKQALKTFRASLIPYLILGKPEITKRPPLIPTLIPFRWEKRAGVRNSVPNSQQTRFSFGCHSVPNSQRKPNCALFYSVFFKFAAIIDYLDYESTLPDMKRTFFSEFKFYTMDKVQDLIKNIPETPYGQASEGVQQTESQSTPSCGSARPSPAEVAGMNKVQAAKTLLIGDTRKAQAISDFVKTMFMRDMVPIADLSTQNCLYEAWLHQISNSDFMYNPDSGEPYSALDLRMQLLYNMAVDYEQ